MDSEGRKLKICHVITRMIVGGAQENTLLTIKGHVEKGHECVLVTGFSPGREGELLKNVEQEGDLITSKEFIELTSVGIRTSVV